MVGAAVKGGQLDHMINACSALPNDPGALTPRAGSPSQDRARATMAAAKDTATPTLQEIGRAAMASHNAPMAELQSFVAGLIGVSAWPAGHHTTATDCYTGESVVVDQDGGIGIERAATASASLPGAIGPTWLGDRLCMDGGVSDSSTHAHLLRGSSFVLILSMFDFAANPPKHVNPSFGLAERVDPGTAQREVTALRDAGAIVHVAIANPDPQTNFMDPATIGPALAEGRRRGSADAKVIASHWA